MSTAPPVIPASETAREPYISPQNIADANGVDIQEISKRHHDKWPQSKRDEFKKTHPERFAGPGTTFPINDAEDVEHAAHLYGHADNPDAIKHKIIQIAKAISAIHALPNAWKEEAADNKDEKKQPMNDQNTIAYECVSTNSENPNNQYSEIKEASILEATSLDKAGHAVRVTIIRGGKSINGYYYDDKALQSIAHLVEGAQAYTDHGADTTSTTRSIRDLVGFYTNAQYIPSTSTEPGRVDADLHILEAASWLWSIISEAIEIGRSDLVGLSIDIFGNWHHDQTHDAKAVTRVVRLNSCDIVTRPSAGGTINRILHSTVGTGPTPVPEGEIPVTVAAVQDPPTTTTNTPVPVTSTNQTVTQSPSPNQTVATEATTTINAPVVTPQSSTETTPASPIQIQESVPPPPAQTQPAATSADLAAEIARQKLTVEAEVTRVREQQQALEAQRAEIVRMQEQQKEIEAQRAEITKVLEQTRLDRAQALLDRRLQESILPSAAKSYVRDRFVGRIYEDAELDVEINKALGMLADLTRDGLVRGHGFDKTEITGSQITEAEKIQAAFDRMFDLDVDNRFGNIRPFTSIREAYARVTGDTNLIAGIRVDSKLGSIHVSESAPIARISEADTTTASFSYLLGTSMNKRLLKDYQAWPAEWMKFCTIAPIRDYKQQTRVRLGAFGSLAIVPEDGAYQTQTLTDSAATYVPQKRGNLVTVSRETIINDDLQSIKQIPTKLAVAAAYTLAEFVYGFLSTNPTIYDGNALFTSGGAHSNLGASALSSGAMQTGITAMREQTNFAGKRLGLRPRFLVVPPELEFVAMVVTKSAGVPGSNNNDINPMLGYVTPVVSPQLTSTTQWFLIGDPREIDTIEIGFVGGQVNPALFVQDQPLFGLNFTQDVITYKVRHEYGGVVTDYRGLYRGI